MCRYWFQGGSFITAARTLMLFCAVNCLSLSAADLRVKPLSFPTTNRVRVEIEGLAAGQAVQLQAIPKWSEAAPVFHSLLTGRVGESVFELPLPWTEEGYFRAIAFGSPPGGGSNDGRWQIDVQLPLGLRRFAAMQPERLAPEALVNLPGLSALAPGWMEIVATDPLLGGESLSLTPSGEVGLSSQGLLLHGDREIGQVESVPEGLRIRWTESVSTAWLNSLVRQIAYVGPGMAGHPRFRVLRWSLGDVEGRRSRPQFQTLQILDACPGWLDLILVLDRTSSLTSGDFEQLRVAAAELIRGLPWNSGTVRAGVVSFCSTAFTHIGLSDDQAQLLTAVSTVKRAARLGGSPCDGTVIGSGLEEALRQFSDTGRRRVLVLLTDGWENSATASPDAVRQATIAAAARARGQGIQLLAYALGEGPDLAHLQRLVSAPSDLVQQPDFARLPLALANLAHSFCPEAYPLSRLSAGPDLNLWLPETALLTGSCPDCSSNAHSRWELISGPGPVSLQGNSLAAQATFFRPGDYQLRLTVSDGLFRAADDLQVTVLRSNRPPVVHLVAGPLAARETFLQSTVEDDGVDGRGRETQAPLRYEWYQNSGPGVVSFERRESPATFARFSTSGDYQLSLRVLDGGGLSATQSITLRVAAASDWESFEGAGYASAALGGLRGRGEGSLQLRGVRGAVRRAYLFWHGPVDSEHPEANSQIQFQGRWIQGASLGMSHDDGWAYGGSHPYATGQAYRADVTCLVDGDGSYELRGLSQVASLQANGASLVVVFEEPVANRRQDIGLWSGNESNGRFAESANDAVLALAVQSDGKVLLAGAFSEVAGTTRNRVARLLPSGQLDLSFDPARGADGVVETLGVRSDGAILVGGSFQHFNGVDAVGLALLNPDGSLVPSFRAALPEGAKVAVVVVSEAACWAGGSFGLAQLDWQGQRLDLVATNVQIQAMHLAGDGTIWAAGSTEVASSHRGWLGRVERDGRLSILPIVVDDSIQALAEVEEGYLYAGGRFTRWNGQARGGLARLTWDGRLDEAWIPEALNAYPGQDVRALWGRGAADVDPWSSGTLIVGGKLRLDQEGIPIPVSLCRVVEGGTVDAGFENLPALPGESVEAVAGNRVDQSLWIGGRFQKETHRNRAHVDESGRLWPGSASDEGWGLVIPPELAAAGGELELHVSDGQPCFACRGGAGGAFLDPTLLLNDKPWLAPSHQVICDVEMEQLFAGLAGPDSPAECWRGDELWDVVKAPFPSALSTTQPTVLRTEFEGAPSQEDFVTLVAAVVARPSREQGVHTQVEREPATRDDRFEFSRREGAHRLAVLGNDWLPKGARITAVSQPAEGTVFIPRDGTSLVFQPGVDGESRGQYEFSYVVEWGRGNVATGRVALTLSGSAPLTLPGQDAPSPQKLTSGPSRTRGPRHFSETFTYEAPGPEQIQIAVLDPEFSAHIYLRDQHGDLLAAAWHDSQSFGAFAPLITPVILTQDLPSPGSYSVEIAGNSPGEGGRYTLSVAHSWDPSLALEIWVNGRIASDRIELANLNPLDELRVECRNLSNQEIADLALVAFSRGGDRNLSLQPDTLQVLKPGKTVQWRCRLADLTPGQMEPMELGLRISAGTRFNRLVEARIHRFSEPPGLHLRVRPQDASLFTFEALPLRESVVAATTFVVESAETQQLWPAPGNTLTWRAPSVGRYTLWAFTGNAISDRLTLAVPDVPVRGETVADLFEMEAGGVSMDLPVLQNDQGVNQLLSVSPGRLGDVELTGDNQLRYAPYLGQYGEDVLSYEALDVGGNLVNGEVRVRISEPAVRWVELDPENRVALGQPVALELEVDTTRITPMAVRFWAGESELSPEEFAPAQLRRIWHPTTSGFVRLRAEVLDINGKWWAAPPRVMGVAHPDDHPPVAMIQSPREGEFIETDTLDIIGTADDPDGAVSYALALSRADGGIVATVTGSGSVHGDRLGSFDLTLLRNGVFRVSLSVTGGLQVVHHELGFILQSDAKIGHLRFAETDYQLPTAGVPLVITRVYDSLHASGGAFGPGWSLALYDVEAEIDEERETRLDPETETSAPVRVGGGRDLTLTLPGGLRATFPFRLVSGPAEGGIPCFCYRAEWVSPPGLRATLTALGNTELRFVPFQGEVPPFWLDAGPETPWESYDFRGWWLTNADGMVLEIARPQEGRIGLDPLGSLLRSVEVRGRPVLRSLRLGNGERVEISDGTELRLEHRDREGRATASLALRRNGQGQVTEIYEGAALSAEGRIVPGRWPLVRYGYDSSGSRLIRVERLMDRDTGRYATRRYEYEHPRLAHYLTRIVDERGVSILQPSYDAEGRVSELRDAMGQVTRLQHDRANRREESMDALGHRTIHEYDQLGNVTLSIDPVGRATRRVFGQQHLLLAETNAWGTADAVWSLRTYDEGGQLSSLSDAQGTHRFRFNERSQLTFQVDPLGTWTSNTYDGNGLLLGSLRGAGSEVLGTRYLYTPGGQLSARVESTGVSNYFAYDVHGRQTNHLMISPTGRLLAAVGSVWDEQGNLRIEVTRRTTADGQVEFLEERFAYDAQNRRTATVDPLGHDRRTELDDRGNVVSQRDELGRVTQYYYDGRGLLVQTVHPADASTSRTVNRTVYNALGHALYILEATALPPGEDPGHSLVSGRGRYMVYDEVGRVVRSGQCARLAIRIRSDLDGLPRSELAGEPETLSVVETGYDGVGRVRWTRNPNGVLTAFGYDVAGRRSSITNAFGTPRQAVQQFRYSSLGLLEASVDPLGHTTEYSYDAWGRRVKTRFPEVDGEPATVHFGFDLLGRQISYTDESGTVTGYEYDDLGRLTGVTNAVGSANQTATFYGYDENGAQLWQQDALGRVTRYAYDPLGRRIQRQLPGGERERVDYDAVGNPIVRTTFDGRTIRQTFDARDRLLRKVEILPGGGEELLADFTYTASGRRASQVDPSGRTEYEYDDWDRVKVRRQIGVGTLEYDYLPGGQVASTFVEAGEERWRVLYAYDELGRLTAGSIPRFAVGVVYDYDVAGRLRETRYANGLTNSVAHDARNRLRHLVWGEEGKRLAHFEYRVNQRGQRTELVEELPGMGRPGRRYQWEYDDLQRLTRESVSDLGSVQYRYDRVGNRLERESTLPGVVSHRLRYDQNDRLDPDADPSNPNPDFDSAGNHLRGEYQGRRFEDRYDAENRLLERRYVNDR